MSEIAPALLADLLREALKEGKSPYLTVISNSMSPLIRRGDQIQLAPTTSDELKPGDIIVYQGPANLITHRYWGFLSENGRRQLVTRGDRPQHFDTPITPASLIGRVTARRRKKQLLNLAGGIGKWLNHHLAKLAQLEIRLFSSSLTTSDLTSTHLPSSGGRLSTSNNNLLVRFIRRILYSWAIILTLLISLFSSTTTVNIEKED
jgi:signal peptidase I